MFRRIPLWGDWCLFPWSSYTFSFVFGVWMATPPETNSKRFEKWWWGWPIFMGYVSFREGRVFFIKSFEDSNYLKKCTASRWYVLDTPKFCSFEVVGIEFLRKLSDILRQNHLVQLWKFGVSSTTWSSRWWFQICLFLLPRSLGRWCKLTNILHFQSAVRWVAVLGERPFRHHQQTRTRISRNRSRSIHARHYWCRHWFKVYTGKGDDLIGITDGMAPSLGFCSSLSQVGAVFNKNKVHVE